MSVAGDSRITPFGTTLRHYKLDELPGLWDVLIGNMNFVGPRPDVPGYADKLEGDPSTGSGQAVWCCPSTSLRNQNAPWDYGACNVEI